MIRDLTLEAALHVCRRMRPGDRAGVQALLGDIQDDVFAVNRWQTNGPAWFIEQDGEPAAIFGIELHHQAAGTAWLLCTPEMHSFKKLLRYCRTVRDNAFSHAGMRRIDALVLADWPQAAAYAAKCGMEYEGLRRCVGVNGETFQQFAVVKP